MSRWFVLHGWGGNSTTNWFPWLKAIEEKKGNEVFVPDFPNTEFPEYDAWREHWESIYASKIEKNAVLIGHSLGGSFLLRWLSEKQISVAGLILVAPAPDDCGIEEVKTFFTVPWNEEILKKNIVKVTLLGAENDPYIPLEKFEALAKELGATFKKCSGGGHLNDKELLEIL